MYVPQTTPGRCARPGVILLVVIALLTMFAVVGVSFVLYSQAQADAARIAKDAAAQISNRPQDAPKTLLGEFLYQFIFDVDDVATLGTGAATNAYNVHSSVRGHSLQRTMYGYNYPRPGFTGAQYPNGDPSCPNNLLPYPNTNAYNGTGRLHSDSQQYLSPVVWRDPTSPTALFRLDEYFLPNYMCFYRPNEPIDGLLGIHDPERLGWRTRQPGTDPDPRTWTPNSFVGGFNPSYTYPDLNNMFLAAVRADGTVLMPSFHRPWIAPAAFSWALNNSSIIGQDISAMINNPANFIQWRDGSSPTRLDQAPFLLDPKDPRWYDTVNTCWRYMTMRPRPADNARDSQGNFLFPPPQKGGDVANLGGDTNDSIWIDLGIPKKQLPDGRWYKPLFAPLIVDLDNRLNINVHGNIRGKNSNQNPIHVSNQGWGPWEVNLGWVLNYQYTTGQNSQTSYWQQLTGLQTSVPPAEWTTIFIGSHTPAGVTNILTPPSRPIYGRYGPDGVPDANAPLFYDRTNFAGMAPGWPLLTQPHFYSQIDYDGWDTVGAQASGLVAYTGPNIAYPGFPVYQNGPNNTSNGWYNANLNTTAAPTDERFKHPLAYNLYMPIVTTVPNPTNSGIYDRNPSPLSPGGPLFDDSLMAALIRNPRDTTATALAQTDLGTLCAYNLIKDPTVANALRRRWMLTTRSFDVDQPGYTPAVYDPTTSPYVAQTATPPTLINPSSVPLLELPPVGGFMPFPPLAQRTQNLPNGSEFNVDWRGAATAPNANNPLGRIDLNRKLAPYPPRVDASNNATYSIRFDDPTRPVPGTQNVTYAQQFQLAVADRQALANDIYRRLVHVTGLVPVANPAAPTDPELVPRRWLAQLAVNIVDYIDEDDINTPFNFYNTSDGLAATNIGAVTTGATNNELLKYWVFGTELPSLVLNEVLAEYTNPGNASFPNNFWAELHNPRQTSAVTTVQQLDNAPIVMSMPAAPAGQLTMQDGTVLSNPNQTNTYAPYQIVIAPKLYPATYNDNILGTPDAPRNGDSGSTPLFGTVDADFTTATNWNGINGATVTQSVAPNGYVLIGPPNDTFTNAIASIPASVQSQWVKTTNMQYTSVYNGTNMTWTPDDRNTPMTVFLRRLANPHLPYNNTPTVTTTGGQVVPNPLFNPYITIDYLEGIRLNNTATSPYASQGKRQPFASLNPQPPLPPPPVLQVVAQTGNANATNNTFCQQNTPGPASAGPTSSGYYWPLHLDRQLVSPMELLNVSGFKPHQLLQYFVDENDNPNKHLVPWFDQDYIAPGATTSTQSHRLYRLFEYLQTNSRMAGAADVIYGTQDPNQGKHVAGRVAGKININTIWDPEILLALVDPQPSNNFNSLLTVYNPNNPSVYAYNPDTLFGRLLASRSPGLMNRTNPNLGPFDQPFTGFAAGISSGDTQHSTYSSDPIGYGRVLSGFGFHNTMFRLSPTIPNATPLPANTRLFEVPNTSGNLHPYQKNELLNKISNNITTRSNVFAVWLTVGFFEVFPDGTVPEKLGKEIGIDQGLNVRHQMFAIVDRSALTYVPPNTPPYTTSGNIQTGVQTITVTGTIGTPDYMQSIAPGSMITVNDNGKNQETVMVLNAPMPQGTLPAAQVTGQQRTMAITAKFSKNHTGPVTVYPTLPGNPGTQPPTWDPIDNSAVVPYFKLLTKAPGS